MGTFTNNNQKAWDLKQIVLIYNASNLQQNEFLATATLAKRTDGLAYTTGTLLALYGANAPAGKAGMYVNYDPASANLDQKVCVGAISQQFLLPTYGSDVVASGSDYVLADAIPNTVSMLPFAIGNGMFYENALTLANAPAVITGFKAAFKLQTMANVEANGSQTNVLSIQGKN